MADYVVEYASIAELMRDAKPHLKSGKYAPTPGGELNDPKWFGAHSWDEVESLSVNGWAKEADAALSIAEAAIETVDQEHDMPAFDAVWDVTGSQVDIGRFLSGEPENMVDFQLIETPRHGRVITLCASVSVSGSVSGRAIKQRGYMIAALAMALTRIGYAVELWADCSCEAGKGKDGKREIMCQRVQVKGPNDELDPARIMMAFAHPAMLRALFMPAMHSLPKEWQERSGVGWGYGTPANPKQDLPEGTIYLPCVISTQDIPNPEDGLRQHLRSLGIID